MLKEIPMWKEEAQKLNPQRWCCRFRGQDAFLICQQDGGTVLDINLLTECQNTTQIHDRSSGFFTHYGVHRLSPATLVQNKTELNMKLSYTDSDLWSSKGYADWLQLSRVVGRGN